MNAHFINSVDEHNLIRVRLMLSNELLLDPRGDSFARMLEYASERLADLYEEERGDKLFLDMSVWDKEYLNKLHVRLNNNFSREKVAHMQDVVKIVLKDKLNELNVEQNVRNARKNQIVVSSKMQTRKELAIMAGGAVSALIGCCVASQALKATLITLGVAGVAYGAFGLYNKK